MIGLAVRNKKLTFVDDLVIPVPKENEVLVKVESTTLNPDDPIFASGVYDDHSEAIAKSDVKTGLEFSGVIEQGNDEYKKGERVYGYVDVAEGQKAHQEYISLDTDLISHMPEKLSFSEATTIPCGAVTVLGALRDVARLKEGQSVLINGAGGGLGVFSIQMAKNIFKTKVTAIGGTNQEEYLISLGADEALDYNITKISEIEMQFDLVFDLSSKLKFKDVEHLISDEGCFIPVNPFLNEEDLKEGSASALKTRMLYVPKGNSSDLKKIAEWADLGLIEPKIDSQFDFKDFESGLERLASNSKKGRVVLNLSHS